MVAVIPVLVFYSQLGFTTDWEGYVVFSVIPISCAAGAGLWIGGQLVDPENPLTTRQAITRGALVAVLAYVLTFLALDIWFTVRTMIAFIGDLIGEQHLDVPSIVGGLLLYIFWAQVLWWTSGLLAGLMLVGWIIIPVGGLAGWLLSRYYQPHHPFVLGPSDCSGTDDVEQR
ncbi:MAG: hypothetical protein KDD77_16500 [Caldilineaceae bacterium]|nr:hypothetical protein [Caldilineaceae bacterium]